MLLDFRDAQGAFRRAPGTPKSIRRPSNEPWEIKSQVLLAFWDAHKRLAGVWCCAVVRCAALRYAVLWSDVMRSAVLRCAALCCAVVCCAVLCRAMLMLCSAYAMPCYALLCYHGVLC